MDSFFNLRTKFRLARSLLTREHPVYVQFYVTARCNLRCEQCNIIYANADASELCVEGIRRAAKNLERIGVSIVLLTGGEPFTRKDLPEIVAAFKERGMHVRIQTNGLASEEALRACVRAGANDISISLDSLCPETQDRINGGFGGSWERAVAAMAAVNRVFPEDAFAAVGCVMSPRNLEHIPDVIRFATRIGWYVSLVPVHAASQEAPRNFRTYGPDLRFPPWQFERVRQVLDEVRHMRDEGYLTYDSDLYLDDIYRFVRGERVRWRDRNGGLCDSPHVYFAVQPNGLFSVCCDHRLPRPVSVAAPEFPDVFFSDAFRREVSGIAASCPGCMYGSFPEMTISTRFAKPFIQRTLIFNSSKRHLLMPYSKEEMLEIAGEIRRANAEVYAAESRRQENTG